MAIKLIGDNPQEQRYLKVTGLTLNTVAAVTDAANQCDNIPARVDVVVNFNIYKNQEERFTPDPEFSKFVTDSRTFLSLPTVTPQDTPYNTMIATGYELLRTLDEFSNKVWEDML